MEAYPTFTFPELLQDMITSKHLHKHFANEELLRDQSQRRRIADVLSRELAGLLTSAPFA